ncbi:MAG: tetratricopeptide repeat protein [Lacipirellulaceae bacterium]
MTSHSADTTEALSTVKRANELAMRGHVDAAERLYLEAAVVLAVSSPTDASVVYHRLGVLAYQNHDLAAAQRWYLQAIDIDRATEDRRGESRTLHNLSAVASKRGDYSAAVSYLMQSIAIKKALGDSAGVANSYHQLGYVYDMQRDFGEARSWYDRAIDIHGQSADAFALAESLWNISDTYMDQGLFERGLASARDATELFYCCDASDRITQVGDYYTERGYAELAHDAYLLAAQAAQRCGHLIDAAHIYHGVGNAACEREDIVDAIKWYDKALQMCIKAGDSVAASQYLSSLGNLHLSDAGGKQRDYRAASTCFRESLASRGFKACVR